MTHKDMEENNWIYLYFLPIIYFPSVYVLIYTQLINMILYIIYKLKKYVLSYNLNNILLLDMNDFKSLETTILKKDHHSSL